LLCRAWAVMRKTQYEARYRRLLRALRDARKAAGLTQTEVGRHFGNYASFVSKIESGERRVDAVELAEFCRLYGLGLAAFLRSAGLE
jgi:transcriptional regulator with XRE-family HTH domain